MKHSNIPMNQSERKESFKDTKDDFERKESFKDTKDDFERKESFKDAKDDFIFPKIVPRYSSDYTKFTNFAHKSENKARTYSLEAKHELCKSISEGSAHPKDVIKNYGIGRTTLYRWISRFERKEPLNRKPGSGRASESKQLALLILKEAGTSLSKSAAKKLLESNNLHYTDSYVYHLMALSGLKCKRISSLESSSKKPRIDVEL